MAAPVDTVRMTRGSTGVNAVSLEIAAQDNGNGSDRAGCGKIVAVFVTLLNGQV